MLAFMLHFNLKSLFVHWLINLLKEDPSLLLEWDVFLKPNPSFLNWNFPFLAFWSRKSALIFGKNTWCQIICTRIDKIIKVVNSRNLLSMFSVLMNNNYFSLCSFHLFSLKLHYIFSIFVLASVHLLLTTITSRIFIFNF